MERLTALAVRRRRSVLVFTVFAAVGAVLVKGALSSVRRTGNDDFDDPDSESYRATELIEQRTGEGVHQAARARDGDRRPDRRDHRPRPAAARPHGPARRSQLVGAPVAWRLHRPRTRGGNLT